MVLGASGSSRPTAVITDAVRRVLAGVSPHTTSGRDGAGVPARDDLVAEVLADLGPTAGMRRVINATGVLLHTNLGRAPVAALEQWRDGLDGYADVEFDLGSGRRSGRFAGLEASLCALTGSTSALVVNNNAAAVLLAVSTVSTASAGREVIVSRGELVEIGGSFRIPDVITQGGAVLREVGTTNRTHVADYRGAVCSDTAAVLSVHRSNYRIEGFTAEVGRRDLAEVARSAGVPLLVDLGGGLPDTRCGWIPGAPPRWLAGEPGVRQVVAAGADVVTFSGDKLLGGPQAGIIVGESDLLDRMRRHPLARPLRLDRVRAQMLQRVVDSYLDSTAVEVIPLWRMASVGIEELRRRAEEIVAALRSATTSEGLEVTVQPMDGTVGAGAAPGSAVPGVGIELAGPHIRPQDLARGLRNGELPVIGVVGEDRVRIHLRTVDPCDDGRLTAALSDALAP